MFSESESFFSAICRESGMSIEKLIVSDLEEARYLVLVCKLVVVMVLASRFAWRTSSALARKDPLACLPLFIATSRHVLDRLRESRPNA